MIKKWILSLCLYLLQIHCLPVVKDFDIWRDDSNSNGEPLNTNETLHIGRGTFFDDSDVARYPRGKS